MIIYCVNSVIEILVCVGGGETSYYGVCVYLHGGWWLVVGGSVLLLALLALVGPLACINFVLLSLCLLIPSDHIG